MSVLTLSGLQSFIRYARRESASSGRRRAEVAWELNGYEVLKPLARGKDSRLFLVRDPKTRRLVVLKRATRRSDGDHRLIDRIRSEYQLSVGLRHPNIRSALRLVQQRAWWRVNECRLVLEFIDGRTLRAHDSAKLLDLCVIFESIADALAFTHAHGVVHADVSDRNILVGRDGTARLIDFGHAIRIGSRQLSHSGSVESSAPELVYGWTASSATDVYGLGSTMYWKFTGRRPPTAAAQRSPLGFVPDPSRLRMPIHPCAVMPGLPAELGDLIIESLQIKPARRPTMLVVRDTLARLRYELENPLRRESWRRSGRATRHGASSTPGGRLSSIARRPSSFGDSIRRRPSSVN
ncbi:MAG: serine/threonine protein kinase [Phycisphaerales bacterium]